RTLEAVVRAEAEEEAAGAEADVQPRDEVAMWLVTEPRLHREPGEHRPGIVRLVVLTVEGALIAGGPAGTVATREARAVRVARESAREVALGAGDVPHHQAEAGAGSVGDRELLVDGRAPEEVRRQVEHLQVRVDDLPGVGAIRLPLEGDAVEGIVGEPDRRQDLEVVLADTELRARSVHDEGRAAVREHVDHELRHHQGPVAGAHEVVGLAGFLEGAPLGRVDARRRGVLRGVSVGLEVVRLVLGLEVVVEAGLLLIELDGLSPRGAGPQETHQGQRTCSDPPHDSGSFHPNLPSAARRRAGWLCQSVGAECASRLVPLEPETTRLGSCHLLISPSTTRRAAAGESIPRAGKSPIPSRSSRGPEWADGGKWRSSYPRRR